MKEWIVRRNKDGQHIVKETGRKTVRKDKNENIADRQKAYT